MFMNNEETIKDPDENNGVLVEEFLRIIDLDSDETILEERT